MSCFRTLAVILVDIFFPRVQILATTKCLPCLASFFGENSLGCGVSIKISQGFYYMRSVEYIFKGWNYRQGQGHIESSTLPCLSILHLQSQQILLSNLSAPCCIVTDLIPPAHKCRVSLQTFHTECMIIGVEVGAGEGVVDHL